MVTEEQRKISQLTSSQLRVLIGLRGGQTVPPLNTTRDVLIEMLHESAKANYPHSGEFVTAFEWEQMSPKDIGPPAPTLRLRSNPKYDSQKLVRWPVKHAQPQPAPKRPTRSPASEPPELAGPLPPPSAAARPVAAQPELTISPPKRPSRSARFSVKAFLLVSIGVSVAALAFSMQDDVKAFILQMTQPEPEPPTLYETLYEQIFG